MRADLINYVLSFTIIIPLIIGLIRIRKIHQSYFLFILFLFFGFLAELSAYFIYDIYYINLIQDCYSLFGVCILLTLFFRWGLFNRSIRKIVIYLVLMIILQVLDHAIQINNKIKIPWGYLANVSFITTNALFLLNIEFSTGKELFFKQPRVLILIPLIIGYLYLIIINILMAFLFNLHTQKLFVEMYYVINYINLFSYISFSFALLWAPKREIYL